MGRIEQELSPYPGKKGGGAHCLKSDPFPKTEVKAQWALGFFRAAIGARRKEDTEGFRRSIMNAREAP